MNKILVDGDKIFLNKDIDTITVSGIARLLINNMDTDINLSIVLNDNASLEIVDYEKHGINKNIEVIQNNNTSLKYIHTFNIDSEYNFKYKATMLGDNNSNYISITGVSKGLVNIDVDGVVRDNKRNNVLDEVIKVLTINGKCVCLPKLEISAKDIIANHNTAISNIRSDQLFYLMSKGITKDEATKLISDGYVFGFMRLYDEEFYNLIKE